MIACGILLILSGQTIYLHAKSVVTQIIAKENKIIAVDAQNVNMMNLQQKGRCLKELVLIF